MRQLPELPLGLSLVAHETVNSTNNEAKLLAASDNTPEGTVVWAKEQTAGKGRMNRSWMSPLGNLYSSIILRPDTTLADAAQIGFLPALAVGEMLTQFTYVSSYAFKWPNDVLLNKKKVSGILLESGNWNETNSKWLVVGCGINLAHSPKETRFPATSIFEETGTKLNVGEALSTYYTFFLEWYKRYCQEGFSVVRNAWLQRAHGLQKPLTAECGEKTWNGRFIGLNRQGGLELETETGIHTIESGDVYFND